MEGVVSLHRVTKLILSPRAPFAGANSGEKQTLYSAFRAWLTSSFARVARGCGGLHNNMDAEDGDDFDIADSPEKRALKSRLMELREEHRALDSAIFALQEQSGGDALQLARLKKRKLVLRDQIQWIEDRLTPDIIA